MCRYIVALIAPLALFASFASAQVSYSGGTYVQDFDTLAAAGSNIPWANNSTLTGWHLFHQGSPPVAITTYEAATGSNNAGSFYSFGLTPERALGGIGSGGSYFGGPASNTLAGWIAVAIENTSGSSKNALTFEFDGEQWRDANNSVQSMTLEYGFGASFDTVATWFAPGGNFDWASPLATNGNSAVNGNTAGLVAGRGGTVFATWNIGDRLWIRWLEVNNSGTDHALAIDNFRFTAVPEPTTSLIGLLTLAGCGFMSRFRRRVA